MKRNLWLTLAVILTALFKLNAQQTAQITSSGIGYLQYLPEGYITNSNKYPVVISLHGIKEKGTSSADRNQVLKDLPRVANVGLPKYVKFGQKYPFILISPQLKSNFGSWSPSFIMEVLNYVKTELRIDNRRIYLTGLSLGGMGVWRTAGEYPKVFAAIVPICPGGNALNKAHAIAAENVAAWGFHGSSDHIASYTISTKMVSALNSAPKKPNPLAKVTLFSNMGHVIWDKVYQQTNVLDWMLSFRKGSSGTESSNSNPEVDAGADKTITLPSHSVSIEGTASDADGEIVSYDWIKLSGGPAILSGATSPTLVATNLIEGTYVFRLTVKDNAGAINSDDVNVTVRKVSSANKPSLVSAGSQRTLRLPENSLYLEGDATNYDGSIISYRWSKVSGGLATFSETNSKRVRVSNLEEGTYIFRLTVTDNNAATNSDDIHVYVVKGWTGTIQPVSYDGKERTNRFIDTINAMNQKWNFQ